MNSRYSLLLAVVALAIGIATIFAIRQADSTKTVAATAVLDDNSAETDQYSALSDLPTTGYSQPALALRAALIERHAATKQLRNAEIALTELEAFIAEIEERGDDPADFADDGLKKFRPAFEDFEAAQTRLELAESIIPGLQEQVSESELKLVLDDLQSLDQTLPEN